MGGFKSHLNAVTDKLNSNMAVLAEYLFKVELRIKMCFSLGKEVEKPRDCYIAVSQSTPEDSHFTFPNFNDP